MILKPDEVIQIVLTGIYKSDVLGPVLYLKGGQAIRLNEKIDDRLSTDIDFSTPNKINDSDNFFKKIEDAVTSEFLSHDFNVHEFKFERQPNIRGNATLDVLTGWAIEFKVLHSSLKHIAPSERYKYYMKPDGITSPKIEIDISEYEYCNSYDILKLNGSEIRTYTRPLLIVEKLRALCQQHENYQFRKKIKNRARDYYDIDRLFAKSLADGKSLELISEMKKLINPVFAAKEVPVSILDQITVNEFTKTQEAGWPSVQANISGKAEDFSFYAKSVARIIREIRD